MLSLDFWNAKPRLRMGNLHDMSVKRVACDKVTPTKAEYWLIPWCSMNSSKWFLLMAGCTKCCPDWRQQTAEEGSKSLVHCISGKHLQTEEKTLIQHDTTLLATDRTRMDPNPSVFPAKQPEITWSFLVKWKPSSSCLPRPRPFASKGSVASWIWSGMERKPTTRETLKCVFSTANGSAVPALYRSQAPLFRFRPSVNASNQGAWQYPVISRQWVGGKALLDETALSSSPRTNTMTRRRQRRR